MVSEGGVDLSSKSLNHAFGYSEQLRSSISDQNRLLKHVVVGYSLDFDFCDSKLLVVSTSEDLHANSEE